MASLLMVLSPPTVAGLSVAAAEDTADGVCYSAIMTADTNNDARLDRVEYVQVVKVLSGGRLVLNDDEAGDGFENLPSELQDVFLDLSCQNNNNNKCNNDTATVDVIRLSDERVSHIGGGRDICEEIRRSINRMLSVPRQADAPPPATAPPHPCSATLSTSALLQRELQATNVSFADCIIAMNAANVNKDNFLNQNEYMTFVNLLSGDAYQGQSLGQAPAVIRRNYFQLAGDNGQIDIAGSKPEDDRTPEQVANLEIVCTSTENAINEAAGSPSAAPSSSPTLAPATDPTTECFRAMNLADTNDDDLLNQNEYFNFVNTFGDECFQGENFGTLPQPFRQNYFQWREPESGQINIFGSKPGQDANAEQTAFLDTVCADTQALLETECPEPGPTTSPPSTTPTVLPTTATPAPTVTPTTTAPVPTEPPTVSPTTPSPTIAPTTPPPTISPTTTPSTIAPVAPPTVSPTTTSPADVPTGTPVGPTAPPTGFVGNATVRSDFIISNTAGKNADDITGSQDETDLALAYSNLVEDVVEGLARRQRRLRRRRLVVTLIDNSPTIESIQDLARCPAGTPEGTLCQNVRAFYRISFAEEDPNAVVEEYTTATEVAINTGGLQEELELIDPNTDLNVVERTPPPTPAPTSAPGDDGLSNGAIAGIAVAGAVVVAGTGAALYFAQRRRRQPGKKPPHDDVDLDSVESTFGGPGKLGSMRPSTQQGNANTFGASGVQVGAGAAETEYTDEDDYSFQSGSFYEDSSSTFQSPVSPAGTTASQIENYKLDDPQAKQYGTAAAAGAVAGAGAAAAAKQAYESSSNAGSSGWSSSEEDTDYSNGSASSSASSDMAESNDSFFRSDNKAAQARGDFFDNPANDSSPRSEGSGSYEDSAYSSDYSPQPASPPDETKSRPAPVPVPIPMPRDSDDESSEAYTTSDDSSYESTIEGRESRGLESGETSIPSAALHDSSTAGKSSGETGSKSLESDLQGSLNERATELESLVEKGDWEGVIASAQKFEADTERANTPSTGSRNKLSSSSSSPESDYSGTGSSGDESSYTSSSGESASDSMSESRRVREMQTSGETGTSFETSGSTNYTGTSTTSETPEEARRREEYRAEVEALVRLVVPEEIDNVDVMMIQFRGREAELVSTLQNMQERSVAQRARAAVHKSKGQPPRRDSIPGQYRKDGNYSTDSRLSERTDDTYGSAAGSAAIAAASVPRPAAGGRVPIHPPPVPAHESTDLESNSSTTPGADPSPQSGEYTTSSYDDSRQRSASSASSSGSSSASSSSGSYDSRSGSSYSSSGGNSSTSGSSYEETNDEYYTSQGTGTNYDTSQGTSFTESQSTSLEEDDRFTQQRRPTQRRASIKPWLTGDDDTHADLDASDLGVSVGGDYHSLTR